MSIVDDMQSIQTTNESRAQVARDIASATGVSLAAARHRMRTMPREDWFKPMIDTRPRGGALSSIAARAINFARALNAPVYVYMRGENFAVRSTPKSAWADDLVGIYDRHCHRDWIMADLLDAST